jgi:pimeloyl-ACP methyl ester carboxylesterase
VNATGQGSQQTDMKPTIVLVHGAFADASSWNGVIERLQQQGYTVIAPANPLRGVTADSAYIASLLGQIGGPVLLGGHSYGGAVITNAATSAPNVVGLVYVAAFAPDEGENLGDVENGSKDSVLNAALVQYTYPPGPGADLGRVRDQPFAGPGGFRRRPARADHRADRRDPAAHRRRGVQRRVRAASLAQAGVLGGGRERRQGRRRRRRPVACPAGGRRHRRGRGLARDHDLLAADGDRPHPESRPGGR